MRKINNLRKSVLRQEIRCNVDMIRDSLTLIERPRRSIRPIRRGAECPAITNNATVDECKPLTKNRMSLEHTDRKINDSVILSAKEV